MRLYKTYGEVCFDFSKASKALKESEKVDFMHRYMHAVKLRSSGADQTYSFNPSGIGQECLDCCMTRTFTFKSKLTNEDVELDAFFVPSMQERIHLF